MLKPDAELLTEARKRTTGANVHSIATAIAYYINELEIYNHTGSHRSLDFVQWAENKLRELVYAR